MFQHHPTRPRQQTGLTTLLFLTISLFTAASSITFELGHGQRKCFSEDFPPSSTVQGTVFVASGRDEMNLDLFVSNPSGDVLFNKRNVNSVKFSVRTANYRPHTVQPLHFCILNQVHPHAARAPVSRRVTLSIKSVAGDKDHQVSHLAKQEHADKVYAEFMTISESVDTLIENMDELRAAEQTLTDLNERTSTTILQISVIACLFTIGTGVLNFMSLKSFFKRKKLA